MITGDPHRAERFYEEQRRIRLPKWSWDGAVFVCSGTEVLVWNGDEFVDPE